MIGTLALGTASLGLSETRDVGGWESARQETGGTARADLDLAAGRYEETAWGSLDGVTGATPVLNLSGNTFQDKSGTINVVAVSPDEFADTFPEYAELVSELDADSLASAGIPLPEEATSLQVQVWSEALGVGGLPEASVLLHAYLIDAKGLPFRIEMSQPSSVGDTASVAGQGQDSGDIRLPTPPEQWITLSGQLPPRGTAPYRLWRVGLATTQGDIEQFAHTIYLDYWQTVDVNGTATILDDQENSDLWSDQAYAIPYPGEWQNQEVLRRPVRGIDNLRFASDIPVFDGDTALQLDYTIGGVVGRNEPSIGINVNLMPRIPVIVSDDFASEFKENTAGSLTSRTPALEVGGVRDIQLNLKTGVVSLGLQAVDIVDEFPTLSEDINERYFIIMPLSTARAVVNQRLLNQTAPAEVADINQVWFELDERKPADEFQAALRNTASVEEATFAWDRFGEILREPLPSAVAGMLFAGFWVSLILSLLDFAFYIAVTAKQRAFSFGVLRSLGWDANNIWRMLLVEQISLVTPALLIGTLLGAALAYLLLPFLELVGESTLQLPYLSVGGMLLVLVAGFTLLLVLTAFWLRRMSVNQVLRLGEE
ncbi:MAG: ABC transporter permease [Chloroflexi bacterium]|nr:ABC transporter permease [Chloroflexota bacterium]